MFLVIEGYLNFIKWCKYIMLDLIVCFRMVIIKVKVVKNVHALGVVVKLADVINIDRLAEKASDRGVALVARLKDVKTPFKLEGCV